jgi:hypothetical protein
MSTDSRPRSGARVIAFLGALLVLGIGLVTWLTFHGDAAPAPKKPTAHVAAPRDEATPAPRVQRPRTLETTAVEPPTQTPQVEIPPPTLKDVDTVKLEVDVFGENSAAAPGATVVLLDPFAQHLATGGRAEIARATSDADGRAMFETKGGMVRVFAWLGAQAGASDKFRPSETTPRVAVRMTSAIAVKGRVVERGGAPVAGASVRFVARPWYDDAFGFMTEGQSDKDGAFELPPVPATAFDSMQGGAATIEARAKSWPASSVSVTADALRAGEVVVTLERGAFLRGRLARPTGDPVGGEEVRLTDGRSVVASDADGRFELPLPRDGGAALARRPVVRIMKNADEVATTIGGGWGAPKLLGRFRGDRGDIDLGDVTLVAGKSVKGVVVDLDDKPVAAGDVTIALAGVAIAATQTDDDGKFEFDAVGDDDHVLTAQEPPGPNTWSGRRHASVDGIRGGATDVRVRITGALSVLVKFLSEGDHSPIVVPEARIRADAVGDTPRAYGWSWAGAGISSVRFEVENAGSYTTTVELPGYLPATTDPFDVSADRGVEISVFLKKKP